MFVKPSNRWRNFFGSPFEVEDSVQARELNDAIASGLIIDEENDLFIKEGYGALVGCVPDNCNSLTELINYTILDFKRKIPGKPTTIEKIKEIVTGNSGMKNFYFGYSKYLEEGADLVIGPGCSFYGQKVGKAVYCKNYLEILQKKKNKNNR